jgi:hypothetical protein
MSLRFLTGAAAVALMAALAPISPASAQTAAPAPADQAAAPASNAMTMPAMGASIVANPNPYSIDLWPILGKTYVTGALTGLGFVQNNTVPGAGIPAGRDSGADLSNGMAAIQKTDGLVQYFLQAGVYSLPVVGVPYTDSSHTMNNTFGPLPLAYLKIAPMDNFSIQAGKLPTLIGQELPFTYENINIQRGLLWNQENLVNRGVQANYTAGPLTFSASWNDGFYTNRYSYLTGLVSWTVTTTDTLTLAGGGNLRTVNTSVGPLANSQQVDFSYTHSDGPWMINPYIQYTHVPSLPAAGVTTDGSTYGAALLVSYAFDPAMSIGGLSLGGFSLPARIEYLASNGSTATGPNLLGYGPGSKAWEITVTPTYQYKIFFARPELSYIAATHVATGGGFGSNGSNKDQFRALFEAGFVF